MRPFNDESVYCESHAGQIERYRDFWHKLSGPGTWWNGAERVAIAAESRGVFDCIFCNERKVALSPNSISGKHTCSLSAKSVLSEPAIDAVHRVISDAARMTQATIDSIVSSGISYEKLVELVSIATTTLSIDDCHRALGFPLEPLPASKPGSPTRTVLDEARVDRETMFVPRLNPKAKGGAEDDLLKNNPPNVMLALSLVPDAQREFRYVHESMYLKMEEVIAMRRETGRSISRVQMELVGTTVSAANECFY